MGVCVTKHARVGGARTRSLTFAGSNEKELNELVMQRANKLVKIASSASKGSESHSSMARTFSSQSRVTDFEEEESSETEAENERLNHLNMQDVLHQHNHVVHGESDAVCQHTPAWNKRDIFEKDTADTELILQCFRNHLLFSIFDDKTALQDALDRMMPELLTVGEVLNDRSDDVHHDHKFFIVKTAVVEAVSQDGKKKLFPDSDGERGFGDLALMIDADLDTSYTVKKGGIIFTLERLAYHHIVVNMAERKAERIREIIKDCKVLSGLDGLQLMEFADHLVKAEYKDGETIVKQGDPALNFYLIEEGAVTMHRGRDRTAMMEITGGHFFGEQALLSNAPRNATFRAKGDVSCLVLGAAQFHDLFGGLLGDIDAAHKKRQIEHGIVQAVKAMEPRDLTVVQIIGKGSFGLVSLAYHKDDTERKTPMAVKQIEKSCLVKTNAMYGVVWEKMTMQLMSHPHIAKLYGTYSDANSIYFVLEYLAGGNVYQWLWRAKLKFSLKRTRIYAACIADSLIHLHQHNVLYRDLKLENVCLDHTGALKLIDFGLSKETTKKTFTTAGTPEYMAPELITGMGHHKSVDYWALGIAIFEMLVGYTTFGKWVNKKCPEPMVIFRRAFNDKAKFPMLFNKDAKVLVQALLQKDASKRLGCLKCGGAGIRDAAFFQPIDWAAVANGTQPVAFVPDKGKAMLDRKFLEGFANKKVQPYRPADPAADHHRLWDKHFPRAPSTLFTGEGQD